MSHLDSECSEQRLARSRTTEQDRILSVLSLVLENTHLHIADRKALRLTCRELRSQVSRRVHRLTIDATVDPDALAASGLLGKQIKSLRLVFDSRVGERPGDQERWSKLVLGAIASCAGSIEALQIWRKHRHSSSELHEVHCWALERLAGASWPELTSLEFLSNYYLSGELSSYFVPLLARLGSAAKFPKLDNVDRHGRRLESRE